MRVLGLDLGSVTCGVAISDPMGMVARTYETIRFEEDDYEACIQRVGEIIEQEKPDAVVIGLPKHMNGDIGIRGEISLEFADEMRDRFGIEVITWDERLTTVAAEKLLISADVSRKKRKKVIDQVAAVGILQSYLDSK
ncbi:MAG: Holliday junction resolvase RuvX [Solobacterium sp.]|nr:Holliday junction resolvase RuvX [Solobacterium sp.]